MAQLNIQVPVPHMGRIEDAHMIVCHMICLVEILKPERDTKSSLHHPGLHTTPNVRPVH